MANSLTLVPRGSATYREFERLYRLARSLRTTATDRWNGDLVAGGGENMGAVHPKTGAIRLSTDHVLRHLQGSGFNSTPSERAQALATILHETTHAGMRIDAPDQPNAVRAEHALKVIEGFAEVRAMTDFTAFAVRAGYGKLPFPKPAYQAPHAAVDELIHQASGARQTRGQLLDVAVRGPGVMHLDQLADCVVRNRLEDVVPAREVDRRAVRAALIATMVVPGWLQLTDKVGADVGRAVADGIRRGLDAKVDQIRQHYRAQPAQVFPADGPNAEAVRVAEGNRLAALPAPDASDRIDRSAPDAGDRLDGSAPEVGDRGDGPVRGGWAPSGRGDAGVAAMRFLDGVAPAAGATGRRPSLGQGARGAGQGGRGRRPESGVERE